jgi:hypothetical protein
VNKSKARRERKFNLDLYRKVQIEYAKTVREISRPSDGLMKLERIDRTLPFLKPSDPGSDSQ